MKILKPSGKEPGAGSLFSSKNLMQYGDIEFKLKSAPEGGLSTRYHTYGIDQQPEAISWYLDGEEYRKITKESTYKDGEYHFPTDAGHLKLGLWDASGSASTAESAQWSF
ncbi:putative glycosidase CRH2 [Umbelopsis sp. WA50703]